MSVQIVIHRDIPYSISKLANDELSEETTDEIIFTGHPVDLEGHMAVYVAETKSIIIDLDACVKDLRWMDQGATFIANAWLNLLYCVLHEAKHAHQMYYEPIMPTKRMEEQADKYALNGMFKWFTENPLPDMDSMGYIGERIKVVLNAMWTKHESIVENEIKTCGLVAANATTTTIKSGQYEKQSQVAALMTEIQEGRIGKILDGQPYLTAEEFIVAINPLVEL